MLVFGVDVPLIEIILVFAIIIFFILIESVIIIAMLANHMKKQKHIQELVHKLSETLLEIKAAEEKQLSRMKNK